MNPELAHVIGGSRWLMEPKAFRAMVRRAELAPAVTAHAAMTAYMERPVELCTVGDVAVIHMSGPITYRRSWFSGYFGSATIEDMQTQFRMALRDESIKTILFRCDTPGGVADMVPEFADEIFASRGHKPILAVADPMICSAGIWLAGQADQLYISTSSEVGSIGVFILHVEVSKMLENDGVKVTFVKYGAHKAEGNPYEPLTDDARASFQETVDDLGAQFDGAMARGRGVSRKVVMDQFGQGQVFQGRKIIAAGLADKTGTFGQLLARLTRGKVTPGARAAASIPQATAYVEFDAAVPEAMDTPVADPPSAPEPAAQPDEHAAAEAIARQSQADADLLATTLALVD
jgi:signal peptide peptidase SppA